MMNAKIVIGGDSKIVCNLLKDAEGKDVNQKIDNVYALKWSLGVGDEYPVGAVSYLVSSDKQAHAQIPAANVELDFGNGWRFHADVDNKVYRLSFNDTIIKGVQYIEIDASRTVVDGQPKTKVVLSFVSPIYPPHFLDLRVTNGLPQFYSSGVLLGWMSRGVVSMDSSKSPQCEATLVIESEF